MKQSVFLKALIIMHLGAILIFASCLHLSAAALAQQFSISEEKAGLVQVFELIEKETDYTVVYRDEWLTMSKPFKLHVKDVSLEELLNRCFEKQPLTYAIVNRTIVIRPRRNQPEKLPIKEAAMQDVVRGLVMEEGSDTPLPGVSVLVKGSSVGSRREERRVGKEGVSTCGS